MNINFGTLHLARPLKSVVFLTFLALCLFVAGGELILRSQAVQSKLALPAISGQDQLGPKIYLADRLMATDGHIDCIVIGNSTVVRGIDPEAFSLGYQAETGSPLKCFNFGLTGLTINGNKRLAQTLVNRYHPHLIVYGIHFKNFTRSITNVNTFKYPWARNQLGQPNFQGALEDKSMMYRYFLTYWPPGPLFGPPAYTSSTISPYGLIYDSTSDNVFDQDDPASTAQALKRLRRIVIELDIPTYQDDLDDLLSLNLSGTQLILAETPVLEIAANDFVAAGHTYDEYHQAVVEESNRHNTILLPAIPAEQIPRTGYQDIIHLNLDGASAYSEWLGHQVGKAAQQGLINLPTS